MSREESISRGLLEAAKEAQVLDQIYGQISCLKDCFEKNPDFIHLLTSPFIREKERIQILQNVLAGNVHLFLQNALKILYENKVDRSFHVFADYFFSEYEQINGMLSVKVWSARELSAEETGLLRQKIEHITGKSVQFEHFVDSAMTGGLKYEYDNIIFDGGVSGNLLRLKDCMASSSSKELIRE